MNTTTTRLNERVCKAGSPNPLTAAVLVALGTVLPGSLLAQDDQESQASQNDQQDQTQLARADEAGGDTEVLSLENWEYDDLYQGWMAEELLDAEVRGPTGEETGNIENLLLNDQGQIVAVIAEVGGFLDIGDTHVAVPWDEVEIGADENVTIPITQETVEDYSLFNESYFSQIDVGDITTVEDDAATGAEIWKATDLLDDYVVMDTGEGYGYINDLVFSDEGQLLSIVANPASDDYHDYGYYAYPWYGYGYYGYAWEPDLDYYVLPFEAEQIAGLTTFDHDLVD